MTDSERPISRPFSAIALPLSIFAAALVVRAVELWQLADSSLLEFILGDAKNYVAWGSEIAAGNWLGDETFYQAPLYPYFLGVLFSILGEDMFAVRVVQIIMGAASCAMLALAGERFFSRRAGYASGLLLAFYAPAFYADAMIQKSVLDIFLVCLCLWILSHVVTRARWSACLGLGITLGIMALTRENALTFPVVLVPWLALRADLSRRQRMALVGFFLSGVTAVLMPVAVRNWVVGDEFHLTTSQFGHNFYIGNNPAADGTYAPLLPGRGDPRIERLDAIDLAQKALGKKLTPSEVSRFYTDRALKYIVGDPLDWLALMCRKVALVFTSIEMVDTEDQYTHAESSSLLFVAGKLYHFGVLAPLALLGLIITWPRRAELLPLYLMFLVYTATLVIFYVFARYRLPLVPFLVLFAGAGVSRGQHYWSKTPRPELLRTVMALSVVAIVCNWPMADEDYMRSVTHYNLGNELAAVGRIDEAVDEFRDAVALYGNNALAHNNLATLLAGRGALLEAESFYRQALKINPRYVEAYFNLARVRLDMGDSKGAVDEFRRGLEVDPRDSDIHNELGEIYLDREEWREAIECFEAALSLNPDFESADVNLKRARREVSAGR